MAWHGRCALIIALLVCNSVAFMLIRPSLSTVLKDSRRAMRVVRRSYASNSEAIPTKTSEIVQQVDYTLLDSDDPMFLDMPWPTETGPESAAFARHMQWKRKLSDGERLRWQRWAVYQRCKSSNRFDYSLQDFIAQNLQTELHNNAVQSLENGDTMNASVYKSLEMGLQSTEEAEVRAVMLAYYAAFNRKNMDEVRALWLPDDQCQLTMPGYERAVGDRSVDSLYQNIIAESKPMGAVTANISMIHCYGNVALVHTVEEVGEGTELQSAGRLSKRAVPSGAPAKAGRRVRVLATTVLRRANKQWRIVTHHAARMWTSPLTGDALEVTFTQEDAARREKVMQKLTAAQRGRSAVQKIVDWNADVGGGLNGLPGSVMQQVEQLVRESGRTVADLTAKGQQLRPELRRRADGTYERVIEVDARIPSTSPSTSSSKSEGQSASAIEPTSGGTEGDAFVRPTSPSASSTGGRTGHGRSKRKSAFAGVADRVSIDPRMSMSKQTVQAIRILHLQDRISQEDKNVLIADLVSCVAVDRTSRTETAFEMLYALPMYELEGSSAEDDPARVQECLADFAAQCSLILRDLRSPGALMK